VGLRGKVYNILKSYLSNRKAAVKIGEEYSEFNEINYGVPQGSILGPLLFLIYTNDISHSIERTMIYLFADDTILISISWEYEEMITNLQHDFNLLNYWFMENELYISNEKTIQVDIRAPKTKILQKKSIVKHHVKCKCLQKNIDHSRCHNKCENLATKENAKYLGIYIDEHWN